MTQVASSMVASAITLWRRLVSTSASSICLSIWALDNACSFSSKAQEVTIVGNWQLTTVAGVGETETGLEVVFIFEDTGTLKAAKNTKSRTIDAGTWKYNKKKKLIVTILTVKRQRSDQPFSLTSHFINGLNFNYE